MAKAVGEWDVDRLEAEMPVAAVAEWNDYLNWELATMAKAIIGAIPAARAVGDSVPAVRLTDPEEIGRLFDAMNKG